MGKFHARIQKVFSEGSSFDYVFLVDEERGYKYHYKRAIIGRFAGGLMVAQH